MDWLSVPTDSNYPRLSRQTLRDSNVSAVPPTYLDSELNRGIVHLGVGVFMRAHLAVYTDAVLAAGDSRWGILAVNLRSDEPRQQLEPQQGLFTVVELDDQGAQHKLVGSIQTVLTAPEDPQAVLQAIGAAQTHVISLTITEKGYCYDQLEDSVDWQHPDIAWDLEHPNAPRSALGFLVYGIRARAALGSTPLTILSCDNLPANGELLKKAVSALATKIDPDLVAYIDRNVRFPCTMVDRIVPAMSSEERRSWQVVLGYDDQAMVKTEPFSQWVIEDRFLGPKPPWGDVGALLVPEIKNYEATKLRLLNGAHSAMAYLGCLAGLTYVHDVIENDCARIFITALMREAMVPTLTAPSDLSLTDYQLALLGRFGNTTLAHRTQQIAVDGSQKLPQRLVAPYLELREVASRHALHLVEFVFAMWFVYVTRLDEDGSPVLVDDPLASRFAQMALRHRGNDLELVVQLFGLSEVFPPQLGADKSLVLRMAENMGVIRGQGVMAGLETVVAKHVVTLPPDPLV